MTMSNPFVLRPDRQRRRYVSSSSSSSSLFLTMILVVIGIFLMTPSTNSFTFSPQMKKTKTTTTYPSSRDVTGTAGTIPVLYQSSRSVEFETTPPTTTPPTTTVSSTSSSTTTASLAEQQLSDEMTVTSLLSSSSSSSSNPLQMISELYSYLTKEHYLIMAFLQAAILASGADIVTQTLEQYASTSTSSGTAGIGIDYGHVIAMATIASTMSGMMNAIWLRQLEQLFPGTTTKHVIYKTLIHAILLASIINSAYLIGVPTIHESILHSMSLSMPSTHIIDTTTTNIASFLMSATTTMPTMSTSTAVSLSSSVAALHTTNTMNFMNIVQHWKLDEFITLTKLEIFMFIPYNTIAFKYISPSIRPLTHASISAIFNIAVSAITLGYFTIWCDQLF